jgi:hypothetical protein
VVGRINRTRQAIITRNDSALAGRLKQDAQTR